MVAGYPEVLTGIHQQADRLAAAGCPSEQGFAAAQPQERFLDRSRIEGAVRKPHRSDLIE